MSRFTQFLKEELSIAEISTQDMADTDNFPEVDIEKEEQDEVDEFIESHGITLEKDNVENIIALVDKTLDDWNRKKNLDGEEIINTVKSAIEDGIIKVKSY